MNINQNYDIVVVGSGPSGATAARVAAEKGLKVLLLDKRQELGAPIQCSGAVSAHALERTSILPDSEYISSKIFGFIIQDNNKDSTIIDYRNLKPEEYGENPLGYVVDRRRFDRYLMMLAERAGATVSLKTEAKGFKRIKSDKIEVYLERFNEKITVNTSVMVGADGIQSQVGKWAGLKTHIKLSDIASCLQLIVDHVESKDLLEIITGHELAPGGYAWIFPKGNDYAEIGLGVIRTMTDKDARWHLDNFIKHPDFNNRFKDHRVLEVQGGGVPLAAPLKKQYADNIILVGDAARHVNPITGGGIHTALQCGEIAGNYLTDFFNESKVPKAKYLAGYQELWMNELGEKMWQLYKIKSEIFKEKEINKRDQMLYKTMSDYFHPDSEFRKI